MEESQTQTLAIFLEAFTIVPQGNDPPLSGSFYLNFWRENFFEKQQVFTFLSPSPNFSYEIP